MNPAFPDELRTREASRLRDRRRAAGIGVNRPGGGTPKPEVGFGLSGGGIRSATFALGFFQGLGRAKLIRHIDYLSTVSGGGYFGSFLGRLYTRNQVENVDDVEGIVSGEMPANTSAHGERETKTETRLNPSGVLRYLRENGRYLSPNGSGDLLLGGAVLLRNWFSVQVVLAAFVVLLFVLAQIPYRVIEASQWHDNAKLSPALDNGLILSPYLALGAVVLVLGALPLGWGYWLVGHRLPLSWRVPRTFIHVLPPLVLVVAAVTGMFLSQSPHPVLPALGLVGLLTIVFACVFDRRLPQSLTGKPGPSAGHEKESASSIARARHSISTWLKRILLVAAGILALAFFDVIGATAHLMMTEGRLTAWLAGAAGAILGIAALARKIVAWISPSGDRRPGMPASLAGTFIAGGVLILYLGIMATIAHAASHGYPSVMAGTGYLARTTPAGQLFSIGIAAVILSIFVILLGNATAFLNRSSHHALYNARLTRAYLGASNPRRQGRSESSVLNVIEEDDVDLGVYHDASHQEKKAMPLHLVNVTVNETIDGRSQVQQQDRKGMNLALGPCGMSVGVRHHAIFGGSGKNAHPETSPRPYAAESPLIIRPEDPNGYRVFEFPGERGGAAFCAEPFTLGGIVAISGAAFSTGLGSRTHFGLSLLCGLGNVRLGYWWDSGIDPDNRKVPSPVSQWRRKLAEWLPVYSFLFGELLARFRGTAWRHWYLSDGGHFENLAGYELIRRRVPIMVILDAEADPDYTYNGLADLIRKARIDFGASIEFLNEDELEKSSLTSVFGSLEQLRRTDRDARTVTARGESSVTMYSARHAALARITYDDEANGENAPERWLVYIKPTLTGDEPADLIEYLMKHPTYPNEPTSDQFFDENQWESYRKLGEHIADLLCPDDDAFFTRFVRGYPIKTAGKRTTRKPRAASTSGNPAVRRPSPPRPNQGS